MAENKKIIHGDDYDLIPHEEFIRLRKELEALKKNFPSSVLQDSVDNLSDNVHEMLSMFRSAIEEMNADTDDEPDKLHKEIIAKVDEAIDHDKKIAEAILSVVDMVKEIELKVDNIDKKMNEPAPVSHAPVHKAPEPLPVPAPHEPAPPLPQAPLPPLPQAPMPQARPLPQTPVEPPPLNPQQKPMPPPPPAPGASAPMPPLPPKKEKKMFGLF
ncbi:hypothetical protein ACFL1H_02565 [Nanoarchaeota archaeon]